MRKLAIVGSVMVLAMSGAATAAECPRQGSLGTSRVLQVKPGDFPLVGKLQYNETLRLADREVVLTFDDGPAAPYTENILDVLANECVKATFFLVGNAVVEAPDIARRALGDGHTVGTHTFDNSKLDEVPVEAAIADIEKGITTVAEAIGSRNDVAPFFRAPDFELSKKAERYALSKGLMVWSADVDAEDYQEVTEDALVSRVIAALEKEGRGILLMRDAQPVVARALPQLLSELKARKFKIVHVMPAKPPMTTGAVR